MAAIRHDFFIHGSADRVYEAITTPSGLDSWWTLRSSGKPLEGSTYEFYFGEDYDWRASVVEAVSGRRITWRFTVADQEWEGTTLRMTLREDAENTVVEFSHTGWPDPSEHYRISSYCWAMYLRLLKRYVERGEVVPYGDRLDA